MEVICGLEKLTSSKDNVRDDGKDRTYKGLLLRLGEQFNIKSVYRQLETSFGQAGSYVDTWRNYQALWDIDQKKDLVYKVLGDEIDKWNQMLNEIRASRRTFEQADNFAYFGGLAIAFGPVQQKVSSKYDQIHTDILNKFGTTLAEQMKGFKKTLQGARHELEGLNLEPGADVTVFVTKIQEMKRVAPTWEAQLKRCKAGQKLLA